MIIHGLEVENMSYAVDAALNMMKNLSSSEPVLFQRDGHLFIASKDGFAQVNYSLQTKSDKGTLLKELNKSTDAIAGREAEYIGADPIFIKGEERYFNAISYEKDDNSICFGDALVVAEKLAQLPEDGKVRMVQYDSSFDKNKYGYGCDGINLWVDSARVVDCQIYLELMREKEDKMYRRFEVLKETGLEKKLDNFLKTELNLELPNCILMTPNIFVSFPVRMPSPKEWYGGNGRKMRGMELLPSTSERLSFRKIGQPKALYVNQESPFNIYVDLNKQYLDKNSLAQSFLVLEERLRHEVNAIISAMPVSSKFLGKWNELHNSVCADKINESKKLTKNIRAGRS